MFKPPHTFWLIAPLILVQLSHASSKEFFAEGQAFTPDGKTLLYKERHYRLAGNKVLVQYFENDGQLLAEKTLDYSLGISTPLFEQLNLRTGEKILITQDNDHTLNVYYQKKQNYKIKVNSVPLTPNLVVDAGFDNLVRQHWLDLQAGKVLSFNYLLPTRGKAVELKIRRYSCEEKYLCLKIFPGNRLLNLIVKNLRLQYNTQSRQLLMFSGKGNISNSKGRYQEVRVHYKYMSFDSKIQTVNIQ